MTGRKRHPLIGAVSTKTCSVGDEHVPTTDAVERFIAEAKWTFARTMWKWPHWYVLEKSHPVHRAAFRELARRIVEEGKDELWAGNEKYPCSPRIVPRYVLGEYKYWAWPGAKREDIDLINRARLDDRGPDDEIDEAK